MIKYILLDYKASIKSRADYAWRYGNAWRIMVIFGTGFSMASEEGKLVPFYAFLFLLLISFFVCEMNLGYLSKSLFLCPIDREQRKKYLFICYILNMGMDGVLFMIIYTLLLLCKLVRPEEFVCVGISFLSLMAINNIKIIYQKDVPKECFCKDRNMGYYSAVKKIGLIVALLSSIFLIMMPYGTPMTMLKAIGISIFTILPAVIAVVTVIRYVPLMLSWNSVFEKCDRKFYDKELRKTVKREEIDW